MLLSSNINNIQSYATPADIRTFRQEVAGRRLFYFAIAIIIYSFLSDLT